jgi:hypothetical protein
MSRHADIRANRCLTTGDFRYIICRAVDKFDNSIIGFHGTLMQVRSIFLRIFA